MRSEVPHEAGIGGEPFDVTFIATVEEDGAHQVGARPMFGVDEVALAERGEVRKAEVVKILVEVTDLISITRSSERTRIVGAREFSQEAGGIFG